MKIDLSKCSEEELWKYVATHLKLKGIDTILVGGAVVSIYTNGLYKSGDLDFVKTNMFQKGLEEAMNEIGFEKHSQRHFSHPECSHLFIEFPSSFLEIGNDSNIHPEEVDVDGVSIKILGPTDCVKDRLASYIHFNARECLDQAVLVAQSHPVDFNEIKRWVGNEGSHFDWDDFVKRVKNV